MRECELPEQSSLFFHRMIRLPRQGWTLYWVMVILFGCGLVTMHLCEQRANPLPHGVDAQRSRLQAGGNMEGKEVRFGIGASTLTGIATLDIAELVDCSALP